MAASALDSDLYYELFGDPELARHFTDIAEVHAMLLVEGTLAGVQGALKLIPEVSGSYLHWAVNDLNIDPVDLAGATGRNAVPVPALVTAIREALAAPEHAAWLHYGATSQDIVDTALMLRLRRVITEYEARLEALIGALGTLAKAHADLPMIARTYGQHAVPTTFGATISSLGGPLLRHRDRLEEMKPRILVVSLSGAAGTLSAMGRKGPEVRAGLAEALGLNDPCDSWHSARDRVAEFSGWCAGLAGSLGKIGEDLILMTGSDRAEVTLGASGGSSTMPQKANPVGPSALVALAELALAMNTAVQCAAVAREARDGAAWMTEWLTLPQVALATGRALALAGEIAVELTPQPTALRRPLDDGLRLWAAEALTFALTDRMLRPDAEAAVKALVAETMASGTPLPDLAQRDYPDVTWAKRLAPEALLGEAPAIARRFAKMAMAS